jgi:hypothetical protein
LPALQRTGAYLTAGASHRAFCDDEAIAPEAFVFAPPPDAEEMQRLMRDVRFGGCVRSGGT